MATSASLRCNSSSTCSLAPANFAISPVVAAIRASKSALPTDSNGLGLSARATRASSPAPGLADRSVTRRGEGSARGGSSKVVRAAARRFCQTVSCSAAAWARFSSSRRCRSFRLETSVSCCRRRVWPVSRTTRSTSSRIRFSTSRTAWDRASLARCRSCCARASFASAWLSVLSESAVASSSSTSCWRRDARDWSMAVRSSSNAACSAAKAFSASATADSTAISRASLAVSGLVTSGSCSISSPDSSAWCSAVDSARRAISADIWFTCVVKALTASPAKPRIPASFPSLTAASSRCRRSTRSSASTAASASSLVTSS
mmetsp:Transcript_34837/g.76273  ORF Transcript_34837/g.76273 Transcript_34837/m.76273 type:complete len:318 (-) Transcript_34837:1217-2170(-)